MLFFFFFNDCKYLSRSVFSYVWWLTFYFTPILMWQSSKRIVSHYNHFSPITFYFHNVRSLRVQFFVVVKYFNIAIHTTKMTGVLYRFSTHQSYSKGGWDRSCRNRSRFRRNKFVIIFSLFFSRNKNRYFTYIYT